MSQTQVGSCPLCGAPIYSPSVWMGVIPPPKTHTCACKPNPQMNLPSIFEPWPDKNKWLEQINIPQRKSKKVEIIELLKKYQQDTTSQEEDAAFNMVIEWFINCTPDYAG